MPRGLPGGDPVGVGVERPDFAVDAGLAQAAGDQLGDLAAEVQDQDAFGGVSAGSGRESVMVWVASA